MAKNTVLVAGASGLVGYAAVRHFSSLPDWDVVAVSRRAPHSQDGVRFVSVDLTDAARCTEVFSQLREVTHVVYAAVNEKPGLIEGWIDPQQMQTNRSMLVNLFEPLEAVATNLEHVSVLQGTKAYGAHIEPFPVPARERWPRHPHENFYWLHEDYIKDKQQGQSLALVHLAAAARLWRGHRQQSECDYPAWRVRGAPERTGPAPVLPRRRALCL